MYYSDGNVSLKMYSSQSPQSFSNKTAPSRGQIQYLPQGCIEYSSVDTLLKLWVLSDITL